MKHLMTILKKGKRIPEKVNRNKYELGSNSRRFFYYKIAGYWWRLSQSQWADHLDIPRTTVNHRVKYDYPIEQILGFEKIIKRNVKHAKS